MSRAVVKACAAHDAGDLSPHQLLVRHPMRRVGVSTYPLAEIRVVFLKVPLDSHESCVRHAARGHQPCTRVSLSAMSRSSDPARSLIVTIPLPPPTFIKVSSRS